MLGNYEFRKLVQEDGETFAAWTQLVEKDGQTCYVLAIHVLPQILLFAIKL